MFVSLTQGSAGWLEHCQACHLHLVLWPRLCRQQLPSVCPSYNSGLLSQPDLKSPCEASADTAVAKAGHMAKCEVSGDRKLHWPEVGEEGNDYSVIGDWYCSLSQWTKQSSGSSRCLGACIHPSATPNIFPEPPGWTRYHM